MNEREFKKFLTILFSPELQKKTEKGFVKNNWKRGRNTMHLLPRKK